MGEALPSTRGMRPLLSTRVVSRVQTREVTMIYFHVPMVTASSCSSSQTTVAKITARVLLIQMVMHLVVTPNSTRTSLSSSNEVRARSPPLTPQQAQPDKPMYSALIHYGTSWYKDADNVHSRYPAVLVQDEKYAKF